jgi:hypothetical protein
MLVLVAQEEVRITVSGAHLVKELRVRISSMDQRLVQL